MIFEHDDAVRSLLRRARVVKVDDSKSQQFVDLSGMASEKPKKIFRPQAHGFTSNPPVDSEGLLLALGGRSDRSVYLDGGHKDYRPKDTPQGGAILYDDKGNVVFAKSAGGLAVNAKTGQVEVRSQNDKVWVKPGSGKNVYLGGDGSDGSYAKVMTEDGPALNVYAKVG